LSLTAAPHSVKLLRLADENACRLAFQSGRADAFFDDISGNLSYAQVHPEARIIDPQPALEKEGIAFAIDQGYSYGDIQALNIEIDHVANEGILPALEKKYGLVTNLTPYENR
jgi:polar amino acid transport system substrate-binding protein